MLRDTLFLDKDRVSALFSFSFFHCPYNICIHIRTDRRLSLCAALKCYFLDEFHSDRLRSKQQ